MDMGIGKNIRFHRDVRLNWTLEKLSEASGVDVGTISALEMRDSKRSQYFGPIAKGLGLTIDELQIDPEEWINQQGQVRIDLTEKEESKKPQTIASTIEQFGTLLSKAPAATRQAVADLILNYSSDPSQGAQIAKAIELLLKPDADS